MIIKTCGLRNTENITALSTLPIDWFGFIFYPKSSRYVGKEQGLGDFLRQAAPTQQRVGVFVNAEQEEVFNAVHDYGLNYVQLHGDESPAYCQALTAIWAASSVRSAKLIKAFRVDDSFDFSVTANYANSCAYFLFDTKGATHGGTGKQFNWDVLAQYTGETPFLLSGGIGPEDVAQLQQLQHSALAGIDVNSCFETSPAVKSVSLLSTFVNQFK